MVLAGQFVVADVFALTLRNFNNDEIKSEMLTYLNQETLNSVFLTFTNSTSFNSIIDVATAFVKAAQVFVELLSILSGTYIFLFIYQMIGGGGACCDNNDTIALFITSGLTIPYLLMLGNTIIAKIRGI